MRIVFVLLLVALCFLAAGLSKSPISQKNVTVIKSNRFLQIPVGIKGVRVARKAPAVEIILFDNLPELPDALWSSWGDGCIASNGKYYTTIGNHLGYDGNSFLYEYNPSKRVLTRIVDVAEVIGQKHDEYGHGKIHAQLQEDKKSLYFATYWGDQKEVGAAYNQGYNGSLLFRYDLQNATLEKLGVIANRKGLPGAILDPKRELLYFYGVEGEKGDVIVYDLKKRAVIFQGGSEHTVDHRTFMLASDGRVYFSNAAGKLSFYDPEKNSISVTELSLPGTENTLRASTSATSKGIIYGMTRSGRMFAFDPAGQTIMDLGPNFLSGEYNAAMVLSPDEQYIYFAPGSHGSAMKIGTPLIQYTIKSKSRKVIAFLKQPVLEKAGYHIAGNYNLQLDRKGSTLYCTFNGSRSVSGKDPQKFGLPSLVVIKIPRQER